MYRYQLNALEIYDDGLRNTANSQHQQQEIDQLRIEKQHTMNTQKRRADFISKSIPIEFLDDIISLLPRTTQIYCVIRASCILLIICQNRTKLERLYLPTKRISSRHAQRFNASHHDFKFQNIKKMIVWLQDHTTQEFWLQSIQGSTTLSDLDVVGVPSIWSLIDTLANIPFIRSFGISYENNTLIRPGLIHLFDRQGQLSNASRQSWNSVILRY
ncbi:hypothetical protein BDA99DRAFT_562384 [Phascolomyces articulosus]|uniref:Uncharacterized protein n=1 Tax=Phascolomyces articulosus TaxID=60185 RepID=A0AAD5PCZ2_9FUNG|nr:hypothetical protein BDA99DRAFT_562384 [Phascolomyces articulosus]